jgi:hypothetical protein
MHRHTLSSLLTDPTSSHSHGTTDAYGQPTPSTSNSSPGLHQLDTNGNGEDGGAPGRKGKGSKKRDKVDGSDGEFDEGALAVGGPEKKVSNTRRSWQSARGMSGLASIWDLCGTIVAGADALGLLTKIRKRNRLALSCTSCKSRKIKCSRTTPCEACCRRGEEAGCHWETARIDVTPFVGSPLPRLAPPTLTDAVLQTTIRTRDGAREAQAARDGARELPARTPAAHSTAGGNGPYPSRLHERAREWTGAVDGQPALLPDPAGGRGGGSARLGYGGCCTRPRGTRAGSQVDKGWVSGEEVYGTSIACSSPVPATDHEPSESDSSHGRNTPDRPRPDPHRPSPPSSISCDGVSPRPSRRCASETRAGRHLGLPPYEQACPRLARRKLLFEGRLGLAL